MRGARHRSIGIAVCAGISMVSAHAQLDGLLGAVTAPMRHLLGRLGHVPPAAGPGPHSALPRSRTTPPKRTRPILRRSGPSAWPTAFEDVLGYAVARHLRRRGPRPRLRHYRRHHYGRPARRRDRACRDDRHRQRQRSQCDASLRRPGRRANRLADPEVEHTVQLNDAQRDKLAKVKVALAESLKTAKAGCGNAVNLPPVNRLNAVVQQIWAVRDAGIYVRAALKDFYDSLTDLQKAAFQWKQDSRQDGRRRRPQAPRLPKRWAESSMKPVRR